MTTSKTRHARRVGQALFALVALSALSFISTPQAEAQSRKNRGTGGYFRYGIGVGGCADNSSLCTDEVGVSFSPLDLELGWRPGVIALEIATTLQPFSYEPVQSENLGDSNDDGNFDTGFFGFYGGLKVAPKLTNRFDPYAGIRVGYGFIGVPHRLGKRADEGLSLGAVGGFDYFLDKGFALGLQGGYYTVQAEDETHAIWTARASLIVYFDFVGGGSSKKKATPKKKKRRRRRRKKPSY